MLFVLKKTVQSFSLYTQICQDKDMEQVKGEGKQRFEQFHLLSTIFSELKDIGPIMFCEIKLTSLL